MIPIVVVTATPYAAARAPEVRNERTSQMQASASAQLIEGR